MPDPILLPDVACPFCKAAVGVPCDGSYLIPPLVMHISRIRARNKAFNDAANSRTTAPK